MIVAESELYIIPFFAITLKTITLNGSNDLGAISYRYVEFNFKIWLFTTQGNYVWGSEQVTSKFILLSVFHSVCESGSLA